MARSLSEKEALILDLLDGQGELYGLELVARAEGELKRGTLYVTLGRMVEKGYLSMHREDEVKHSGLPRPRYRVTSLGQRMLSAQRAFDSALAPEGIS